MAPDLTSERFQALLAEHGRIVLKIAASYARGAADRADLAQEITVQLWRAFPRYDPARPFTTWMYRIALNVAISHLRRERTRARHVTTADTRLLEVADPAAPEAPTSPALIALNEAIASLDPLSRALVLLNLDGYDHAAIAEVLGIGVSNVGTRLHRVKRALRERLEGATPKGD